MTNKLTVSDVVTAERARCKAIFALPGDAKLVQHLALETDLDVATCAKLLASAANDMAKEKLSDSQRDAAARLGSDRTTPAALTAFEQGKLDMQRAQKLGFVIPPAPLSSVGGRPLGRQGLDD